MFLEFMVKFNSRLQLLHDTRIKPLIVDKLYLVYDLRWFHLRVIETIYLSLTILYLELGDSLCIPYIDKCSKICGNG